MKEINEPHNSNTDWSKQIIEDLSFIKKHLRYPLRRMTIMPVLSSGILLVLIARFVFVASVFKVKGNYFVLIILLFLALPTLASFKRYIDLLRFFPVETGRLLTINMKLLERFLEEQRLVTFRHPDAPEVYQIISKNITAVGDEREVLIFIADDDRILINSHFTSSRKWFRLFNAATHHREMTKQLKDWLSTNSLDQQSTSIARHQ